MNSKLLKPRFLLLYSFALIVLIILVDLLYYGCIVDINRLKKENPQLSAFMKYRINQWEKQHKKKKINCIWMPLSKISPNTAKAVVCAEDAKFWTHDGFDFGAIRYAMEKNIKLRKAAIGASTITQQLAKNLYLSPSKTPLRKINEAILTWRLERALTKNRILELYLNVAEWGDGIFGIEAASRHYFKKPALLLDQNESVLMASVLPNPLRFSPVNPSKYVLRRSRLINRLLGGDIDAAVELHSKKSEITDETEKQSTDLPGDDTVIVKKADIDSTAVQLPDSSSVKPVDSAVTKVDSLGSL